MQKHELMSRLRLEAEAIKADLCQPDTKLVWGEGNLNSRLILVGEAPGAQEDRAGRPFVGTAGKRLDREIEAAGLHREMIYITNIVKCRTVYAHDGRMRNRTPNAEEIMAWSVIVIREIEIIAPAIILCLGAIAASALIHSKFMLSMERGKCFDNEYGHMIATFHPSYLRWGKTDKNRLLFRSDLKQAIQLMGNGVE